VPDAKPAKATLIEVDPDTPADAQTVTVQFNPETLKVTYANQIVTPQEGKSQENASMQFVGAGTMKLALQIWFDVTGEATGTEPLPNDVRELTRKVTYFITPRETPPKSGKYKPPIVRFKWGTFQFDGIMESLEESLEFFASDGTPLRASMTLALSNQRIEIPPSGSSQGSGMPPGAGGPGTPARGTQPLSEARAGDTLQGLAARAGAGVSWQAIATANNIDNPRALAPGQLVGVNLSASASASVNLS
jgi:hypothetical protein